MKLARDRRGIVMMEFMIALFPVMLAFLAVTQYSLLSTASFLVRHSANTAARAAVVILEESDALPDLPDGLYGGSPAGELEDPASGSAARSGSGAASGRSSGGLSQSEKERLSAVANSAAPKEDRVEMLTRVFGERGDSRMAQIRTAAYFPMLAISPDAINALGVSIDAQPSELFRESQSVERAIGTRGVQRALGAFLYNLGMLAVTFPEKPGSDRFRSGPIAIPPPPNDVSAVPITVRVSYLFRCMVPFASMLICDAGYSLATGAPDLSALAWKARALGRQAPTSPAELEEWFQRVKGLEADVERQQARSQAFKRYQPEFDQVEIKDFQTLLLYKGGGRYFMLRSEATLPLQVAQYYPRAQ